MIGALTTNRRGERVLRTGQTGDRLIGVILAIVIAAAIAFIGVDVTSEINESVQIEDQNDTFDEAQQNISGGFTDAMGLIDIVFIVLMFSVILGALLAFRVRT